MTSMGIGGVDDVAGADRTTRSVDSIGTTVVFVCRINRGNWRAGLNEQMTRKFALEILKQGRYQLVWPYSSTGTGNDAFRCRKEEFLGNRLDQKKKKKKKHL